MNSSIAEIIFIGDSKMAKLMRSQDWSATPVGQLETWSQSLKTAIRIMLGSPYPMGVWWGKSMTHFYNDAYSTILGQRHPQALGQSAFVVWADDWGIIGQQAETVFNEGKSSQNIHLEEADLTFFYSPLIDDDERVGGVFCTITFEQERERFLAVGSDLQVITGNNGYFQWVSPSFERFLGWTVDEMLSRPWTDFVHPDDINPSLEEADNLFSGNETFAFENRYRHKDGSYRWLLWNAQPYPEEQVIYGAAIDITDRKQVSLALRDSQERISLAINNAGMATWDINLQTEQAIWSHNHFTLFGYEPVSSGEATYEMWRSRVHPDDLETVLQAIKQAEQTRSLYSTEYRIIRADNGEIRWLSEFGRFLYDETGKAVRFIGIFFDTSDRKQAEIALRQSNQNLQTTLEELQITEEELRQQYEELEIARDRAEAEGYRYQDLFNFAPDGYVVTDAKGIIQEANRAIADLVGIEQRFLINTPLTNYIFDSDSQAFRNLIYELSEQTQVQKLQTDELSIKNQTGHQIVVAITGTVIRNAQGQIVGFRWLIQDISDRKRSEAIIAANEAKLRGFVEASVVGILYGDIYGNIAEANDELLRIVGYTREDLEAGKLRWIDITPPEFLHLDELGIAEARARGACIPYEKEYIRKDGSRVPVLVGYSLVGEARIESVAFILDLTERKQAEEALLKSEAHLKQLVELNLLGVMFWDTDGTVLDANDAFLNMVGYSREDLQAGRVNWRAMTPPEQIDRSETSLNIMRQQQYSEALEKEYIRKDGKRVPILLGGVMFKNSQSRGVSFVVDISQRKQAELQLQQQAAKLLQLNATLEETTAKLIERNQELDRFVYTVSHDLKAPLRGISNLSQWIADDLEGQLDKENLRQIQLMQSRVTRMEALINGLLAYSRIGRTEVATERVKVSELIAEIIDSITHPSTFTISIEPEMPTLFTKRLLLSQVFSNLISNAIKHNDRSDGLIEIKATQKGKYYEFSISDNGPGIAPENHQRVFDIFQTLRGQEVPESTGIGLSIVKKIIETEGGLIVLESQLAQGATFRFTWPLQPE
ncbi:hypothetical protein C7H19_08080 [Aphanothece hegewaldii CCALA 016]|uniref:histidine kinase n=1 Tax=Aphanothece hegewaldii CCALA 016 TaxID=2107694 RepID=A0A2T1LZS9_9CHRO|nr:PAS domain-containing sensor histidine kinase [Aphanothece hegewaldii]PSF37924.1 hypothetical protein C7H19_08080 [Aphanothece hegewaldii CCALA 016]